MDIKQPGPMTPFDEITIPKQLRIIKLLLPFMPNSAQHTLGIFIKFLELQYTIQYFQNSTSSLNSFFTNRKMNSNTPSDILDFLFPYLSSDEIQTANTFRSIINILEMMQHFSETESSDSNDTDFNPIDLMMGMLSSEQQEMFQSYQSMFSDIDPNNLG